MIKSQELRIGNWIKFKDIRTVVLGICNDSYLDPDGGIYPLEKCYPIELNAEILLKCGFEKYQWQNAFFIKTQYGHLFIHFFNGSIITSFKEISSDKIGHRMKGINFIGNKSKNEKIIFLHQLQNIFFFLTGKELNVNM